ncbi:PorP/SprF family type IX secretion system membrane protein [Olivibacter domesticus]|uniref:Type IX secretion system membrane protein, PorP/SprF family n=1 Tax=Olivibacter domesticus TaxID=407022 RepID=A0A1H7GB26_OLID1|nr:PorP/SprF family type IX secretion system membrane protein [Olivibacter domesticus]SEK35321.1 type IX secretion system membrane protein, PorP/SprF family [Olivibacter domesticus]
MRYIKSISVIAGLLLVVFIANAQQALTYNQYANQPTALNPTASLLRPDGEVALLGRKQWVGLEGAPTTYWMTAHLPWRQFGATVGINVRHESLAIEDATELSAFLAKSIRISESEYLAMSMSLGISLYNGNFSQVDPQDPAFRSDIRESTALMGFGVLLYRPDVYYAGFSMPRLALSDLGSGGQVNRQYNFSNQYHAMGGVVLRLDESFDVKPAFLASYVPGVPLQADLSAVVYAEKTFGLGINARTNNDLSAMAEIMIGPLKAGYSYQFNSNDNPLKRRIDNATHEIGISYRLGNRKAGLL